MLFEFEKSRITLERERAMVELQRLTEAVLCLIVKAS